MRRVVEEAEPNDGYLVHRASPSFGFLKGTSVKFHNDKDEVLYTRGHIINFCADPTKVLEVRLGESGVSRVSSLRGTLSFSSRPVPLFPCLDAGPVPHPGQFNLHAPLEGAVSLDLPLERRRYSGRSVGAARVRVLFSPILCGLRLVARESALYMYGTVALPGVACVRLSADL